MNQGTAHNINVSFWQEKLTTSSNVMKIIVNGLRTRGASPAFLPPLDVFNSIGALTFNQLANLRHRGAFTTVSSTFTACCQITQVLRSVYPDLPVSENHLRRWYEVSDYVSSKPEELSLTA
jgi:hypothetical protein